MYAYISEYTSPITEVVVGSVHGPEAYVNLGQGVSRRVHKSQLFTQHDVALAADDLMFPRPDGEEVQLSKALEEVIDCPLLGDELATRLSMNAIERYVAPIRTFRELSLHSEEEMLAGPEIRGSNRWKIEVDLVKGIDSGLYKHGVTNEIKLAEPAKDIEVLPAQEAAATRQKIDALNRRVLDKLYDEYGANFAEAEVVERQRDNIIVRHTIIPATYADFCFVETAFIPENEAASSIPPAISYCQIVVGKPDYSLEKGYFASM